jgi:hypothetical protein
MTRTNIATSMVNGYVAQHGCYIDSHHGQFMIDGVAMIAETYAIDFGVADDPREYRFAADRAQELGLTVAAAHNWEQHIDAAERLIDRLNEATVGTGVWGWNDGDFGLYAEDDDAS